MSDVTDRECAFRCSIDCAEWCCGGATLVTIDEIRTCYDVFPVTVGFRRCAPLSDSHRDLLASIGFRAGGTYVVGDFIAGNRFRRRCRALGDNNLCSLHGENRKPSQCGLVPFCAIYPEEMQHIVFRDQRQGKFSRCKGFRPADEKDAVVWSQGKFIDPAYGKAFHRYQAGLLKQRPFMEKILSMLRGHQAFRDLLEGEGILEVPIPLPVLFEILDAAGFTAAEYHRFISNQARLCRREVKAKGKANPVLGDYLASLTQLAEAYAAYLAKREKASS